MAYYPPPSSGGVTDGDKGDISVSGGGATWTLDSVVNSTKIEATGWKEEAYLRGDKTWQIIAGGGDVTGPASSTNRDVPIFSGTGGKTLADSGVNMPTGATTGSSLAMQYITTQTAYTFPTSGPALRKMFNSPTNGSLTVASQTMYRFEVFGSLSSMATGTYSFGFLGTASTPALRYVAFANKGAVTPVSALLTNANASSATALVASTATATGQFMAQGVIEVETGGTLIPAIATSVEMTPIIGVGSTFAIYPIGADTDSSVGNWS